MPKYLITASYTAEGVKGLARDGGTRRRQAAEAAITSAGGRMESFYFAFGTHDAYIVIDAPDNASVAATSLAVNASGAVQASTVVLLTPEEMDQAAKKTVAYTPPGR